jgi:hypothetical protein
MAFWGQLTSHALHWMQESGFLTATFSLSFAKTLTGHTSTQVPQLLHFA